MIKIIEHVTICPYCKTYMQYDEEDVQIYTFEYTVYGGETASEEYKGITCPKCSKKINVE